MDRRCWVPGKKRIHPVVAVASADQWNPMCTSENIRLHHIRSLGEECLGRGLPHDLSCT